MPFRTSLGTRILALVTPSQVRAYAQSCVNEHQWLKITSTDRPDKVCPYCASADVTATSAWTLQLPRTLPELED